MGSLTIKNVPRRLHQSLRTRAQRHRRSLNSELLACLETAVDEHHIDPEELLVTTRRLRARIRGQVLAPEISQFKNEGRL